MPKPKRVENAVFADDQERLSAMGRAGGKASAEKRKKEQHEREVAEDVLADISLTEADRKLAGATEAAEERGDHLIPEDDR